MKLLINANLGHAVVQALIQEGHEVVSADKVVGKGADDAQILAWAQTNGYIVITKDHHFNKLIFKDNQPHAGIAWLRLPEQGGQFEADAVRKASQKGLLKPNATVNISEEDLD